MERVELTITGRKFPLLEIRKQLLAKHEKYMRLNTDTEIESMSFNDLQTLSSLYCHTVPPETNIGDLRHTTKRFQRSRSLVLWHDHGTVLHLGCILITVHVAYDPATFYTQQEYEVKSGCTSSIQSLVETPTVYLLAAGSSSVEDQIALLQDRLDCLIDLSTEIVSSNGVSIGDKLHFFIGDHPAQQFERGTQKGGTYRCGGCDVKDVLIGDLAHALQRPWRSLQDLQDIAIKGKFGKQPSNSKPFSKLCISELREELRARHVYDFGKKKEDIQARLDGIMCGVQRVPTLLLLDPKQSLSTLQSYK